jgi:hypothetical protein
MNENPDSLVEAANSREHLLEMLEGAIDEAHRKVEQGRVYDAENEKVRQGWVRSLGYLAGQYRQVLNDRELEEMAERIKRIEAADPTLSTPETDVATDGGTSE